MKPSKPHPLAVEMDPPCACSCRWMRPVIIGELMDQLKADRQGYDGPLPVYMACARCAVRIPEPTT